MSEPNKAHVALMAMQVQTRFNRLEKLIDSYADKPLTPHRHDRIRKTIKYLRSSNAELLGACAKYESL